MRTLSGHLKKGEVNQKNLKKNWRILVKYDNFFKTVLGKLKSFNYWQHCLYLYSTVFEIMT